MSEEEEKTPDLLDEETEPADDAAEQEPTIGEIVTGTAKVDTSSSAGSTGAAAATSAAGKLAGLPLGAWAAIAVVALVLGVIIGAFAFGAKSPSNAVSGAATLEEGKLDSVVATYTYDGKETPVTAEEVLESQGALEYYQNEDGSYNLPSSEMVISYVRNQALLSEADKRGVSASDEDLAEYAVQYIGTSDYAMLAESYGMSEDAIRDILRTSYVLEQLQEQVMSEGGDGDGLVMPEEPPAPASYSEGSSSASADEDEADYGADDEGAYEDDEYLEEGWYEEGSEPDEEADADSNVENGLTSDEAKQYADYIIALAGDEWDSAAGTWASSDGQYASALATFDITADSASYEAAMTAFYVAYQDYAVKSSEPAERWEQFTNEIFAKVQVTLYTLVS